MFRGPLPSDSPCASFLTGSKQAAIDLDQQEIELLLTDQYLWGAAQKVYEQGAHSKSYAEITLAAPLEGSFAQGAEVQGTANDGSTISGKIMAATESGAQTIQVQYATSDKQVRYVGCQVGGSSEPFTDGCKFFVSMVNIRSQ